MKEDSLVSAVVEAIRRRDLAKVASDKASEELSDARKAESYAWEALRDYQDELVQAELAE